MNHFSCGRIRLKGELYMDRSKRNYDAFISYKHDPYVSRVAHAVLRKLECYRPPKSSGAQKKKLYLCIDDQNFATAGVLNKQICEALDNSEYLIYLACPETLGSGYCLDEIRYFKKLHDGKLDNIIVLLLKGKPESVLPQELCYEGCWDLGEAPDMEKETEVHWLDLRADNIKEAIKKLNESLLMVAAPLLHCEPDELIQRDRQRKKQKQLMWGMLCVVMSAVAMCVGYTLWLTWTVDYIRQAENARADGNDNMALFYYAKTLSLNPFDEEARINAQILLQKKAWPMVVKEEEDSAILGNHTFPIDLSSGIDNSLIPVCITTGGEAALWKKGNDRYYCVDVEGNNFEELVDVDNYFYFGYQNVADAWCFSNKEEPRYIFYWPKDERMEKLDWSGNFQGEWDNAGICALQPGVVAVMNFETLAFYQLEDGLCRELYSIELKEVFHDDQTILEKYNISIFDCYVFDMWSSPDGSRFVISANFWYNSNTESFCHSEAALFDTDTYRLITVMESRECLISNIVFQDDSQKLALLYNNEGGILENCGYAAVYDHWGNLVFQTERSSAVIPWKGYFCGEVFLLCDLSTAYFLDSETGEPLSEPLLLHVNQAYRTDDGQIAMENAMGVRYCRLVQYSGGTVEENMGEDMIAAYWNEMNMRYQLMEDLWLFTSDDRKEICLSDENGLILDRFLIQETGTEKIVLALSYGINTQTAFVLDDERDLYCIYIDLESKKFASREEVFVHGGILDFSAAKDGVVYLDRYFPGQYFSQISNLMYTTNDNFLFFHDPAVKYLAWISKPNLKGSFAGLFSGTSDYAVIATRKEGQVNLRFFSIETGDFLTDMALEESDDLFVCLGENDNLFIYSGGNWQDMWLGSRRADSNVTQQLMDLSGYMLSGSRFENNRRLEYAEAVMSPDSLGSWSECLEWTFLPFNGVKEVIR